MAFFTNLIILIALLCFILNNERALNCNVNESFLIRIVTVQNKFTQKIDKISANKI